MKFTDLVALVGFADAIRMAGAPATAATKNTYNAPATATTDAT